MKVPWTVADIKPPFFVAAAAAVYQGMPYEIVSRDASPVSRGCTGVYAWVWVVRDTRYLVPEYETYRYKRYVHFVRLPRETGDFSPCTLQEVMHYGHFSNVVRLLRGTTS